MVCRTNINLSTPYIYVYENFAEGQWGCKFFTIRNPKFSTKHTSSFCDILCSSNVRVNHENMSVKRVNTFRDFAQFLLHGQICKMSCLVANCLRRRTCVEFQHEACKINFANLPIQRNWKVPACFSFTEHIPWFVEAVAVHKI